MSLQEKLIVLRKAKKLSQAEVAEAADVSRQAVSRWEVGASIPSTENLKVLSNLYEVSMDYLVNDSTDEPETPEEVPQAEQAPQTLQKKMTRGRKVIAALSCVIVLLLALQIYTAVTEEDDIIPMETLPEDVVDITKTDSFQEEPIQP